MEPPFLPPQKKTGDVLLFFFENYQLQKNTWEDVSFRTILKEHLAER